MCETYTATKRDHTKKYRIVSITRKLTRAIVPDSVHRISARCTFTADKRNRAPNCKNTSQPSTHSEQHSGTPNAHRRQRRWRQRRLCAWHIRVSTVCAKLRLQKHVACLVACVVVSVCDIFRCLFVQTDARACAFVYQRAPDGRTLARKHHYLCIDAQSTDAYLRCIFGPCSALGL